MKRITILGDGAWGTALALVAHRNGHDVTLWSAFPDYLRDMSERRENTRYLPGIPLPTTIRLTSEPAAAVEAAEAIVIAVPSRFFGNVLRAFAGLVPPNALVISVTKGLDPESGRRMTEVAADTLGHAIVCALSGPSFAEEVARGLPTAVVSAARDLSAAVQTQRLLGAPIFRIYTTDDVVGVELGGALKNVVALAAGVCDGLGLGDNARAALITRGLAEIARLGRAMGARAETFAGLSGIGDLVLTCTGRASRNHRVGERLGRGERLPDILAGMQQVAEGVTTCATACALAKAHGVRMPITESVRAMLDGEISPHEALQELLRRDPRPEYD